MNTIIQEIRKMIDGYAVSFVSHSCETISRRLPCPGHTERGSRRPPVLPLRRRLTLLGPILHSHCWRECRKGYLVQDPDDRNPISGRRQRASGLRKIGAEQNILAGIGGKRSRQYDCHRHFDRATNLTLVLETTLSHLYRKLLLFK